MVTHCCMLAHTQIENDVVEEKIEDIEEKIEDTINQEVVMIFHH